MSDSEFHSCKGGEAGGGMEPGAIARGAMLPLPQPLASIGIK
jgi:hypothetical protein